MQIWFKAAIYEFKLRSTLIDTIRADSAAGVEIKIPRGIDGAVRLFHQRGQLTRDFLDHEAIHLCLGILN